MNKRTAPEISVIIPVYNEAPVLKPLIEQLLEVMHSMGKAFEIILVDDGSTDGSRATLLDIKSSCPELIIIFFRRNFGQSAAMTAGFDHARGNMVVTMDGDLQNDPRSIPILIDKLEEGYDLVNGWRKDRRDAFLSRRLPSVSRNLKHFRRGRHTLSYGETLGLGSMSYELVAV